MTYIDFGELVEKLDPEDILERLGVGKIIRSGNELRCACPVHGGKKPNFAVNTDTGSWYCHSRECHGKDLLDLYAQARDLDLRQAAEELSIGLGGYVARPKPQPTATVKSYTFEYVKRCWEEASPQGVDTYFSRKKLSPPPIARFGKNPKGYHGTLIPYRDIDGDLKMVLSCADGKFNFKAADSYKGAFAILGVLKPSEAFYIGEGIATTQTAWEASERQITAVSCGSWSNMLPVMRSIKEKYPKSKPIVLIDCDSGGSGIATAGEISKEFPDATFIKPSFEGLPNSSEAKDFNDLISVCGQDLTEVKRQLMIETKLEEKDTQEETHNDFYVKLGKILRDQEFAEKIENRDYEDFEREHKNLYSSGSLVTGFELLDKKLCFFKGDFVVAQGMSNHGKSTFILHLCQRFLSVPENEEKDPLCIFITYESSTLAVETKFLNIIGEELKEGRVITYDRDRKEKHLYPEQRDFSGSKTAFSNYLKESRVVFLPRVELEQLEGLIDLYQAEFPNRTIALFLDYIQIIDTNMTQTGWEKIKEIAYRLEKLADKKKIVIVAGSQVNEKRQSREGKDIYNAATTVIDVLNHSHEQLNLNEDSKKLFVPKFLGKNVCSVSVIKQKHGESFALDKRFLFNGTFFEENKEKTTFDTETSSRHTY